MGMPMFDPEWVDCDSCFVTSEPYANHKAVGDYAMEGVCYHYDEHVGTIRSDRERGYFGRWRFLPASPWGETLNIPECDSYSEIADLMVAKLKARSSA